MVTATVTAQAAAGAVFAITFLLLAAGRVGRLPLPRGAVALGGGLVTALLLGVSWRAVDLDVILLIVGLMVLAGLAEAAGAFAGLRRRLAPLPPWLALWCSLAVVAIASAVLLNDAAIVILVPYLGPFLARRGLAPVPVVAFFAVAANVGSLLTPFGNPQNAVLASAAGLGVLDFLAHQAALVAIGLALLLPASRLVPVGQATPAPIPPRSPTGRRWVLLAVCAFLALAVLRPWGIGLGLAAWIAVAAAYAGLRPSIGRPADLATVRAIDANVIALFVGLYLLTGGLPSWVPDWDATALLDDPMSATAVVTVLSNTIGNVPAVLTLLRLDPAWTVAHAHFLVTTSTLGGALLLTGSAASLLAAEQARRMGTELGFLAFLRWAVPCTLPVLALGAWMNW